MIGLLLSSIVQYYAKVDYYSAHWYSTKNYGIQLLLDFHHSTLIAVLCEQYFNDSCLVQESQ